MAMNIIGRHGNRPWPPTGRETEHDPACLHDAPGPGGHVCDLGCEAYIEQVEAYWDGFDDLADRVVDLWNQDGRGGWIPGGAYKELADLLQVNVDRLNHYDPDKRKRHTVRS